MQPDPAAPVRLCATLAAAGASGVRAAAATAVAQGADLVEVRLDHLGAPDPSVCAGLGAPVVATCRPVWEGGRCAGAESERERALRGALEAGAAFVDVEWAAAFRDRLLATDPHRVVLSLHDFGGVPPDLEARVEAMLATGAAVVKVAVLARRLRDLMPLLACGRRLGGSGRLVLIAMGDAGMPSRILARRFGSCWTYAGDAVAPGQLPLLRLLDEFGVRGLAGSTPVYGVVGRPVSHSASPAIHNAGFRATGVDAVYVPFAAETFDDFLAVADALGVEGCSVTAPFKGDAAAAAAERDEATARLGAANTLRRTAGGGWAARNTDAEGFLRPLGPGPLDAVRATVLGAGGAARAVAWALAGRGARVTVRARREDAARAVAALVGAHAGPLPPPPGSWDLLVNATPVGTAPGVEASPMAGCRLDGRVVYDLVYHPPETALLRAARASGCRAIGGFDMLVGQAAAQFAWWTGRAAPVEVMRAGAAHRLAPDSPAGEAGGTA